MRAIGQGRGYCRTAVVMSSLASALPVGAARGVTTSTASFVDAASSPHRFPSSASALSSRWKGTSDRTRVSVLQFNILAGHLGTEGHFPYVDPSALRWEGRRETLVRQIIEANMDVCCLET